MRDQWENMVELQIFLYLIKFLIIKSMIVFYLLS